MSLEKKPVADVEKEPKNPFNWLIGFDFLFAIVVLALSALGYIVLK